MCIFQTQTFLNGGDCIDAIITLLIDLSITSIASHLTNKYRVCVPGRPQLS